MIMDCQTANCQIESSLKKDVEETSILSVPKEKEIELASSFKPEDASEESPIQNMVTDQGFVIDVCGSPLNERLPSANYNWNIPIYEQVFRQSLPCHAPSESCESVDICMKEKKSKLTCFNCGGEHNLSACLERKDQQRINAARRQFLDRFTPSSVAMHGKQRYHIEDDPRFSEMKPGIISESLREALGITNQELPPYIYQMRILGYPPGHLENAKQSNSGLSLFDKNGLEMTSDGDLLEDGEVNEKHVLSVEYNFDRLVDYPGFNVDPPVGTKDESLRLGMPPMPPAWNKNAMKSHLFALMKMNDKFKRKTEDDHVNVGNKKLKADVCVDMDIEEIGEDTSLQQMLTPKWIEQTPVLGDKVANATPPYPPPPPPASLSLPAPPLPEEPAEEQLPPLPVEPSPPNSPSLDSPLQSFTTSIEQPSMESADVTGLTGLLESKVRSSELSTNRFSTPLSCKTVSMNGSSLTFGGSLSFCLGTPVASSSDDSERGLPDASKFASGVSDLILHDNLPNSTGTFDKLRVVLTELKNKSSRTPNKP